MGYIYLEFLTHSLPSSYTDHLRHLTTMETSNPPEHSLHAMNTVINTAELLEAILDQLPFLDLVLVTRVNHRFLDFINVSKKLKRKLFMLPVASTKHNLNKHGVIGSSSTQKKLRNNPIQEPVHLLPSLLVESTFPRTAHLTKRATRTTNLPYKKFLTNPPCAHLTVHFTYVCIAPDGTHIQLEATRSSSRAKGVTLWSVEQMLFQPGAVKIRCGTRATFRKQEGYFEYGSTMNDEIESFERLYGCKMKINLPQTTLRLYVNVLPQDEENI